MLLQPQVARWQEARPPSSCKTVRAMDCREKVADAARATAQVRCLRVQALVTVSDRAEVDPISAAPGNPVTGLETLAVRVRREIDLLILAGQVRRVID